MPVVNQPRISKSIQKIRIYDPNPPLHTDMKKSRHLDMSTNSTLLTSLPQASTSEEQGTSIVVKKLTFIKMWHVSTQLKVYHWDIHSCWSIPKPPSLHILPELLQTAPESISYQRFPPRKLHCLKSSQNNFQPWRLNPFRAICSQRLPI